MSVRRTWTSTLAGAFAAPALLFALTGCGGDDSVADPPLSSPPTSSPTEAPQHERPAHFIRRWAKAEARMENTGETDGYLALSQGCDACQRLAHKVQRYYAAGGFVKWGGWRILSIEVNSRQPQTTTYAVRNRSLPTSYKTSETAPTKHFAGGVTTELLQLERAGASWNLRSKAELAS
jgi:hypothetical protein